MALNDEWQKQKSGGWLNGQGAGGGIELTLAQGCLRMTRET